jgi:hypothetical protein
MLRFVWFSNMSKLVQIQYDMSCYNSCDPQTCLNMLKHVWTCPDSIWYELLGFIWFSNMSECKKICIEQRAHKRFRVSILKGSGLLSHCFMQNERLKRGGLRKRPPAFLGQKKFMYLNKFSMIFYVQDSGLKIISKDC